MDSKPSSVILALFVIENSAIFHVGISNKRAYAPVDVQILSCQPRVTVRSCFVYKVIRDL